METTDNEGLVSNAQRACEVAIDMPDSTDEDIQKMLEYIRIEEAKVCRSDRDKEIWRTAFVFHQHKRKP